MSDERLRTYVAQALIPEHRARVAGSEMEAHEWERLRFEVAKQLMKALDDEASHLVRLTRVREPWDGSSRPAGLRLTLRCEITRMDDP